MWSGKRAAEIRPEIERRNTELADGCEIGIRLGALQQQFVADIGVQGFIDDDPGVKNGPIWDHLGSQRGHEPPNQGRIGRMGAEGRDDGDDSGAGPEYGLAESGGGQRE